uniref:Uncharacterized protein n=1 Tax=Rhizophora mucronata TaxID=61149 RepID=A0A2P2J2K8_RHIMU
MVPLFIGLDLSHSLAIVCHDFGRKGKSKPSGFEQKSTTSILVVTLTLHLDENQSYKAKKSLAIRFQRKQG